MTCVRTLSPQASELLDRLCRDPDDVESHLVFADAMSTDGDPQGELIVLMHRLGEAPDDPHLGSALDTYLAKHKRRLFGELTQHRGIAWDLHLGFLRSVRYTPDHEDNADAVVRSILDLPIAALLRDFVVFESRDHDPDPVNQDAFRAKTLPEVRYAKKHASLDEAVADGEKGVDALWLDLAVEGDALPPDLWRLSSLERLELRTESLRALPAELAKLTKLRRIDIDFCPTIASIPDEVFGIQNLSYMSMYDCHALGPDYHMGRVNNLLGGFVRARTPPLRRRFETALMMKKPDRAFEIVARDPAAMVANLLAALDNGVGIVREEALRALARWIPAPLDLAGKSFALLGSTSFDRKELKERLAGHASKLTTKIDESTTHVIVGESPGGKQGAIGPRPIVLESHLIAMLAQAAPSTASTSNDELAAALATRDETTVAKALAVLKSEGVPPKLFASLVVVAQDVSLKKSREAAKKLLAIHAPRSLNDAMRDHLKSSLLLESLGESKRSERITAFCAAAKVVDPLDLADLLARRARVGLKHLFSHAPSARIAALLGDVATQQTAAKGTSNGGRRLDLGILELSEVPSEVGGLDDVEELDLRGNHLSSWPEPSLVMKSLRRLNISSTSITKVPESTAKMKLVALDMSRCRLRKFPPIILQMKDLEELLLSNSQEYVANEARITGMPSEIGGLERLRVLGYRFNILETFPETLFTLPNLEELDLFACDLPKEIPAGFAKLARLRTIDLRYSSWKGRKSQLRKVLPAGCKIQE